MYSSNCCKNSNGYYNWKCVTFHCEECKNIKIPNLKCMNSEEQVRVSQFELTKTPYDKSSVLSLHILASNSIHYVALLGLNI